MSCARSIILPSLQRVPRLLAVVILLALLALPAAAPAHAAAGDVHYVSPNGSDSGTCSTLAGACKTIAYALGQAAEGDTLLLSPGTYKENLIIDKGIRIARNPDLFCPILKLVGSLIVIIPCPTLDGSQAGRVIDITTWGDVSLEGLTIRNGQVTDADGAGIRSVANLTLDHVILRDNAIVLTNPGNPNNYEYHGGGIANNSNLTVRDSRIVGNTAYDGGGIHTEVGITLIQNTQIAGNTASRFGGGLMDPYCAPLTLENATLNANSAEMGGGVAILEPGNLTFCVTSLFRNVTFSGNAGKSDAGGLIAAYRVEIDHATFANNTTSSGPSTELTLLERQTTMPTSTDLRPSRLSSTLVFNPSQSKPTCWIPPDLLLRSGGHNLSGDGSCGFSTPTDQQNVDPLLLPLADNGGPVMTHALPAGSPAIDRGGAYPAGADARGVLPRDGDFDGAVAPDVGAYEYTPLALFVPLVRR